MKCRDAEAVKCIIEKSPRWPSVPLWPPRKSRRSCWLAANNPDGRKCQYAQTWHLSPELFSIGKQLMALREFSSLYFVDGFRADGVNAVKTPSEVLNPAVATKR